MYVTQNDYYDLRGDFETVYSAAMDLDDRELLKKLLNISSTLNGQEISKYARIVQNIAIKQNRWDIEQNLRMGGLVY